jgi:hypothetical protein
MKRTLLLALTALLLTMGFSSAAHASSFTYNLDAPIQTANPGDTVYFWATLEVFNQIGITSAPVFLFGDTYNIDSPLTLDDLDFFIGFPASIDPGDTEDNVLFTVTLPSDTPTGTYFRLFLTVRRKRQQRQRPHR